MREATLSELEELMREMRVDMWWDDGNETFCVKADHGDYMDVGPFVGDLPSLPSVVAWLKEQRDA